ncbi:DUF1093 domain-containing protein [Staphylococcus saprophyticus]
MLNAIIITLIYEKAAQFNPLIRETDYYVQVSNPLKKNGKNQVGAYTYMTDGFDKDGVGHTVTFNGMKKLKKELI